MGIYIYSRSYKYINTELHKYNDELDKFESEPHVGLLSEKCTDIMYIVNSTIKYTEMK